MKMRQEIRFLMNKLDELERDLDRVQAITALDEIEAALWEMMELARKSAEESCTNAERALLQKKLERLRQKIDAIADSFGQLMDNIGQQEAPHS